MSIPMPLHLLQRGDLIDMLTPDGGVVRRWVVGWWDGELWFTTDLEVERDYPMEQRAFGAPDRAYWGALTVPPHWVQEECGVASAEPGSWCFIEYSPRLFSHLAPRDGAAGSRYVPRTVRYISPQRTREAP